MDNVEPLMAAAGTTTANIVKLNYYATQATDFPTLVQIRQRRWAFDPAPSVTAIPVSALARPGISGRNRGVSDRFDGAKSMTGFIPAPIKPEITMDHLEKVDIRTGMVKRVELVRTSNKLVRLTVDFGDRRRTVLAGLRGERADPKAEIEGCQALFVVNLPARRIAGEISEAMLFDIGYADSLTPVLAIPEKPLPNGARAG